MYTKDWSLFFIPNVHLGLIIILYTLFYIGEKWSINENWSINLFQAYTENWSLIKKDSFGKFMDHRSMILDQMSIYGEWS